ncbi:MAG: PepSY-like domain-containing protein [Bacteroidetes bacterium]|nr:PepSY-like domain-containing protein [Bacteroidota bacterium]
MKHILAVVIASFILVQSVSAQSTVTEDVPNNVYKAFSKSFPEGDVKKWEKHKEGYVAHFKKDGRKYHAYYSHEGKWKGTETHVRRTRHLPTAVQAAWENSGYVQWYVHNIRKIETPDQQLYVLHLNNGTLLDANKYDAFKEDKVLTFTQEGQLVKTEKI